MKAIHSPLYAFDPESQHYYLPALLNFHQCELKQLTDFALVTKPLLLHTVLMGLASQIIGRPERRQIEMKARLRRQDNDATERLRIGDLVIDVAGHRVTRDEVPIALTPLEFDLVVALARKPWQVFSREALLEQVWGYRHQADTRLVNVHVQRLRAKVERDPERPEVVVTVRGVGYRAGTPTS